MYREVFRAKRDVLRHASRICRMHASNVPKDNFRGFFRSFHTWLHEKCAKDSLVEQPQTTGSPTWIAELWIGAFLSELFYPCMLQWDGTACLDHPLENIRNDTTRHWTKSSMGSISVAAVSLTLRKYINGCIRRSQIKTSYKYRFVSRILS